MWGGVECRTRLLCEGIVGVPPEGLGELLRADALVARLQAVEHSLERQGHARYAAGDENEPTRNERSR